LSKIVRAAEPLGLCDVVEIGPGPGGLTMVIQESIGNRRLFAIEKDTSLKRLHDDIFDNVEFIYNDAMNVNLNNLTNNNIIIIANLPYNIGSKLLVNWLLNLGRIKKMILMFQTEVADRICASVGTRQYGRLSVISQLFCKTEKLFDISSRAFFPSPNVGSTLVKLTKKYEYESINMSSFQKLISCVFQNRRKSIYSILRKNYKECDVENILSMCNVNKNYRPESIDPVTFTKISELLYKR
jgi:16S rRNA (adenine1518-N6/adenine1519-N6)-dimethyltransferase